MYDIWTALLTTCQGLSFLLFYCNVARKLQNFFVDSMWLAVYRFLLLLILAFMKFTSSGIILLLFLHSMYRELCWILLLVLHCLWLAPCKIPLLIFYCIRLNLASDHTPPSSTHIHTHTHIFKTRKKEYILWNIEIHNFCKLHAFL